MAIARSLIKITHHRTVNLFDTSRCHGWPQAFVTLHSLLHSQQRTDRLTTRRRLHKPYKYSPRKGALTNPEFPEPLQLLYAFVDGCLRVAVQHVHAFRADDHHLLETVAVHVQKLDPHDRVTHPFRPHRTDAGGTTQIAGRRGYVERIHQQLMAVCADDDVVLAVSVHVGYLAASDAVEVRALLQQQWEPEALLPAVAIHDGGLAGARHQQMVGLFEDGIYLRIGLSVKRCPRVTR